MLCILLILLSQFNIIKSSNVMYIIDIGIASLYLIRYS
jgi:hypothetical protein